jgi:tungstate transport system substrate-binding protein
MNTLLIASIRHISLLVLLVSLLLSAALPGCTPSATPAVTDTKAAATQTIPVAAGIPRFKIATTTSLYDTGLWNYLEPMFEKKANVRLDIVYAGTGVALEYGRRGDVDALVVHDPRRRPNLSPKATG